MSLLSVQGQELLNAIQQPGYPNTLTPDDLDSVFDAILPFIKRGISDRVRQLIRETGNSKPESNGSLSVPQKAFTLQVEGYAKDSLNTYLFKTKKWQDSVPLIPFIMKAVQFSINRDIGTAQAVNKVSLFICPACKEHHLREPLVELSENVLYCKSCSDFVSAYTKPTTEHERYSLAKKFTRHSKRGVRCPKCSRFVPISLKENGALTCPYPKCGTDCTQAYGYVHPKGFFSAETISFSIDNKEQTNKESVRSHLDLTDIISDRGCFSSTDNCVEQMEIIQETLEKLNDIISTQKNVQAKNAGNKMVMYEAIQNTVNRYPAEMIAFLVKKDQTSDIPIYATIFQEFSRLMLASLPTIRKKGSKTINITSPTDKELHLFTGIKSFVGEMDKTLCIKKPTILWKDRKHAIQAERTRNGVCCFIGYIRRIVDESGKDLTSALSYYSFVNVQFREDKNAYEGKKVLVEYYAIPAHYSMKSMAHLRRIINKITAKCIARKLV